MMYNQKMVASIKSKGQILREFKDTVYVKFGSEYSIVLKNLNTVKALVNIIIDGTDVCAGGIVVEAGRTVEIERWVKNGNMTEGNRFKFIERTGDIEQHRGVRLEDGLIRVEYQFEKLTNAYTKTIYDQMPIIPATPYNWPNGTGTYPLDKMYYGTGGNVKQTTTGGILRGWDINGAVVGQASSTATYDAGSSARPLNNVVSDVGITVPGSKSTQQFVQMGRFPLDAEKHSIVLKLAGETEDNRPVRESVTVKAKPKCVTCGKQNKATAKFCNHCGTALEIFA
jgi:hypothetical protein